MRKTKEILPLINRYGMDAKGNGFIPFTQTGYIQSVVRKIFANLAEEACDTKEFKSATKFAQRCLVKVENGEFDIEGNCSAKKFQVIERRQRVRCALFDYFVDVRTGLKRETAAGYSP